MAGRRRSSRCSGKAPRRGPVSCFRRPRGWAANRLPFESRLSRLLGLAAGAALAFTAGWAGSPPAAADSTCAPPRASAAYTASVTRALASGRDLWGDALLRAPGGPTFLGASGHLAPILYARSAKGRPLTRSGVYYLPFADPGGPLGAGSVALHVADGSEIISERAGGPALRVGRRRRALRKPASPGSRRPGSPRAGCRFSRRAMQGYSQESFAARIPETGSLVSFVRVSGPGADPPDADRPRAPSGRRPARSRLPDLSRLRRRRPLERKLARSSHRHRRMRPGSCSRGRVGPSPSIAPVRRGPRVGRRASGARGSPGARASTSRRRG